MKVLRILARVVAGLLLVALVLVLISTIFLRRVTSDEMAPSLLPGDWVWVVPDAPTRGDIVQIEDPNAPGRTVLRRILAEPEQKVRWDEGGLRVNGKRVRQQEKESGQGVQTAKETIWSKPPARATSWRIQQADRDRVWKSEPYEIPADSWYVLSDNRSWGLDSRWWGAVPKDAVKGVVRLRVGVPTEHRERFAILTGVPDE